MQVPLLQIAPVVVSHVPGLVQLMGVPVHCRRALHWSWVVQALPSLHAWPTAGG